MIFPLAILPTPALAASGPAGWQSADFSDWRLTWNENDFILSVTSTSRPKAELKLAESFERKISEIPKTIKIILRPDKKDITKFAGKGAKESCEIYMDGIAGYGVASRQRSSIVIHDITLAKSLFSSKHQSFVISFPDLALSYTFPTAGFKEAFNRIRYLHLQLGQEKRSQAISLFSNVGSIVILTAAGASLLIFFYFSTRKRHLRAAQGHTEKNAGRPDPGNRKKSAQKKAPRDNFGGATKNKRNQDYKQSGFGQNGRATHEDDAAWDEFSRLNFSAFGSRTGTMKVPKDVEAALNFFNLPVTAKFEEVKHKRLFMLKAYHPDRFQGDAAAAKMAEKQTTEINYNFDILRKYFGED